MAAAAAEEGVAGLFHQVGDVGRLRGHREGAGVDPPGIQQVADQAAHVVGLVVDDAEELPHLGRVQVRRGVQHGGGRTLDGRQRRAQLVAHHAEELGAQAVQFLERREILHGHHHPLDGAADGADRRGVDQHGDAPAVGDRELDLLRAHGLAA